LRAANTARDKDLEQFRRSLSTQPKPAAAAAGGPIGVTMAESQAIDFGGTLRFNSWTFQADPYGGPAGNSPSLTEAATGLGTSRGVVLGASGWYSLRWFSGVNWSFAADPEGVTCQMVGFGSAAAESFVWTWTQDTIARDGARLVNVDNTLSPVWFEAGDELNLSIRWSGGTLILPPFGVRLFVARLG